MDSDYYIIPKPREGLAWIIINKNQKKAEKDKATLEDCFKSLDIQTKTLVWDGEMSNIYELLETSDWRKLNIFFLIYFLLF